MDEIIKNVAARYAAQTGPLPSGPSPTWDMIKAWKQRSKSVPPTPFGKSRAVAIYKCQRGTMGGKGLETCMNMGEYRYLMELWDTLPGNYSAMDVLNYIIKGRSLTQKDIDRKVVDY